MSCQICGAALVSMGSIAFDRNNADVPIENTTPMEYMRCTACDFISCPEMLDWPVARLASEVYNSEYVKYDPDYALGTRDRNYYSFLKDLVSRKGIKHLKHLDYGSGGGGLVKLTTGAGWSSIAYDPFSSPKRPESLFNLITAIEVIEHSQNISNTLEDIKSFLAKDGVIVFSTQLAKPEHDINWWYIGARNGHISMASEKTMKILGQRHGLFFTSITPNVHIFQKSRSHFKNLFGVAHTEYH